MCRDSVSHWELEEGIPEDDHIPGIQNGILVARFTQTSDVFHLRRSPQLIA